MLTRGHATTAIRGVGNEPTLAKESLFSLARGLTHWNMHGARVLVRVDVAEGLHCVQTFRIFEYSQILQFCSI